jgi:hypothetical protein
LKKVPAKLPALSSSWRRDLRTRFAKALSEVPKQTGQRVFAPSQTPRCLPELVVKAWPQVGALGRARPVPAYKAIDAPYSSS